jgi:transcriptional regulator GlxA family with amidase domain
MKKNISQVIFLLVFALNSTTFAQNQNSSEKKTPIEKPALKNIGILLFENFETLDVFGPVEILGRLKDMYQIEFYSLDGGIIKSTQNVKIVTQKLTDAQKFDIFLIPGGMGTRLEVNNPEMISKIAAISNITPHVLTVCTGSALLAKTGLLNGLDATSNKRAFEWVSSQEAKVNWIKKARWAVDGKFYTSSGISAGMDMTLGFVRDLHGLALARKIAYEIEYTWQEDKETDEFYLQDLPK